jgi:glycosyltransferase involved in cell wall biosynthesis
VGLAENRRPSAYFDTAWYLDKNPILQELGLDPIRHYFMFGCHEKKSPSPLFDAVFYAKTYAIEDCADLFGHYLNNAENQDRQPCSWFDPGFYRQTYLAGQQVQVSPLHHFLETGLANRLYPNREVQQLPEKPIISVVVPVYNVDPAHLNSCIRSVLYQSYPHWELCLADDRSTDPRIGPLLAEWMASDNRIKVTSLAENSGISAATNAAAGLAGGSWLAFLDNDDELSPDALQVVAARINRTPGDLYYSDEDLVGADGRRFSIFRKPGFNGELLLCHNYITHWVVTKKALYDQVGGCDSAFDGAQDLDLFLKLAERAASIVHIPQVLYHWRASLASTSINHDQKTYADQAGRTAVAAALARRGESAEVLFTDLKFYYRAKRKVGSELLVSVIVVCNHEEGALIPWLTALLAAPGYKLGQLLLLVTNPTLGNLAASLGRAQGIDTTWLLIPDDLGPVRAYDMALELSTCDLIAFVTTPAMVGDGWLASLVEYGQLPDVGVVGGRIDYPPGHPELVTPIPDCQIAAPGYYARFLSDCSVLMNGGHCPQEVLFVNGGLCLIKTALLRAVGGLNTTDFPHLFAFHDLCFRLRCHGKKNIYTPYCRAAITADDGGGRRATATDLRHEQLRFREKWFDLLSQGDPFYNTGILTDSGRSVEEFKTWLTGSRSPSHP